MLVYAIYCTGCFYFLYLHLEELMKNSAGSRLSFSPKNAAYLLITFVTSFSSMSAIFLCCSAIGMESEKILKFFQREKYFRAMVTIISLLVGTIHSTKYLPILYAITMSGVITFSMTFLPFWSRPSPDDAFLLANIEQVSDEIMLPMYFPFMILIGTVTLIFYIFAFALSFVIVIPMIIVQGILTQFISYTILPFLREKTPSSSEESTEKQPFLLTNEEKRVALNKNSVHSVITREAKDLLASPVAPPDNPPQWFSDLYTPGKAVKDLTQQGFNWDDLSAPNSSPYVSYSIE